jgi:hypothetical protein
MMEINDDDDIDDDDDGERRWVDRYARAQVMACSQKERERKTEPTAISFDHPKQSTKHKLKESL